MQINVVCSRKRILAGVGLVVSQIPVKSRETTMSWYCFILLQFAKGQPFVRAKVLCSLL